MLTTVMLVSKMGWGAHGPFFSLCATYHTRKMMLVKGVGWGECWLATFLYICNYSKISLKCLEKPVVISTNIPTDWLFSQTSGILWFLPEWPCGEPSCFLLTFMSLIQTLGFNFKLLSPFCKFEVTWGLSHLPHTRGWTACGYWAEEWHMWP